MSGDDNLRAATARWLDYARWDLQAAETLLAAGENAAHIPCFHAQQAAEKALKAAWTWFGDEPPRTHDLDSLRQGLPPSCTAIAGLADLSSLTYWSVSGRYPGDADEADAVEAVAARDLAREVVVAVAADLERAGFRST